MNHTLSISKLKVDPFKDSIAVFGASILLALLSKVSIPLFFTPVPMILQNNAILLLAYLFGKRGALSTLLFVSYGIMGFPVFSTSAVGMMAIMGPTGGYILGYVIAAFLVAHLAEKQTIKTPLNAFLLMSLGSLVIMTLGCFYLSLLVGLKKAIYLGILPFILTNFLKTLAAARLTKTFKWILKL